MTPERIAQLRKWLAEDREDYDVASNARSVLPECLDEVERLQADCLRLKRQRIALIAPLGFFVGFVGSMLEDKKFKKLFGNEESRSAVVQEIFDARTALAGGEG